MIRYISTTFNIASISDAAIIDCAIVLALFTCPVWLTALGIITN